MYVHELLMRARQDELHRAATQHRLAAEAKRLRPSLAVRLARRAGQRRSLRTVSAGARSAAAARAAAWPEGGSR